MSGPNFNGVGPFAVDITTDERARRIVDLEIACVSESGTYAALCILRSAPGCAKRRDDALRILNSLPPVQIRHILARLANRAARRGRAA